MDRTELQGDLPLYIVFKVTRLDVGEEVGIIFGETLTHRRWLDAIFVDGY